jgi:hypothetical protein
MDHPIGLLLPWLVFTVAVALKAWKIGRLINQQLGPQLGATARDMDRFRAELELGWQRSQSLR